jgi:hypothetical protein
MSKEQREVLVEHASKQLDWLKECQALFYKARQLTLKQRHHLYAHDELAMCTMRIQLHDDASMRDRRPLPRLPSRGPLPACIRGFFLVKMSFVLWCFLPFYPKC